MSDERRAGERSQVQALGGPAPKTWYDYEAGCLATYGGGYRGGPELEAFRHGMTTVFNLLRAEFPPAEECRANAADYRAAVAALEECEGLMDEAALMDPCKASCECCATIIRERTECLGRIRAVLARLRTT